MPEEKHAVAHLHVGLERHVLERQPVAPGAAHDALPPRALDHRAHAGGAIGDQLHLGVRALGQDDAADQPVGRAHRAAGNGLTPGHEHEQRLQPRGVVDVDHVGEAHLTLEGSAVAERVGEPLHLLVERLQPLLLHAQIGDLALEARHLVAQRLVRLEAGAGVPGEVEGAVDRSRHRRDQAERRLFEPRRAAARARAAAW